MTNVAVRHFDEVVAAGDVAEDSDAGEVPEARRVSVVADDGENREDRKLRGFRRYTIVTCTLLSMMPAPMA